MGKMTTYKALQDCRVDTFRRKGEVFEAEAFEDCPPYLEEVAAGEAPEVPEVPVVQKAGKRR